MSSWFNLRRKEGRPKEERTKDKGRKIGRWRHLDLPNLKVTSPWLTQSEGDVTLIDPIWRWLHLGSPNPWKLFSCEEAALEGQSSLLVSVCDLVEIILSPFKCQPLTFYKSWNQFNIMYTCTVTIEPVWYYVHLYSRSNKTSLQYEQWVKCRLRTVNRTQFLKLLFYIYFEIWSFIHMKVKIYTLRKMAWLHTGIIIHYLYYFFFQQCTVAAAQVAQSV